MPTNDLLDPNPELVRPLALSVDGGLSRERAAHLVKITQTIYTFWHTGDIRFLHASVDAAFADNTLPAGRPQGFEGVALASKTFRAAVPDLTCELADVVIAGAKAAVRLVFRGHFSGEFEGVQGDGRAIEFIAFDIQHVGEDLIFENWHLEDNLAFLLQAGIVTL
ncbi:ester cyclase [Catenulispora yoronensis]|uniref:Ester cyclase n=1 Tax=Catenulispora yoronensis TaxID=450799 RepID=A0ABP5F3F3_9ACTN